jgi:hypothetical protein
LSFVIVRETLRHPVRYALSVLGTMVTVVSAGAALGVMIRDLVPGTGVAHFVIECALWLTVAALVASPLAHRGLRERLIAALPG